VTNRGCARATARNRLSPGGPYAGRARDVVTHKWKRLSESACVEWRNERGRHGITNPHRAGNPEDDEEPVCAPNAIQLPLGSFPLGSLPPSVASSLLLHVLSQCFPCTLMVAIRSSPSLLEGPVPDQKIALRDRRESVRDHEVGDDRRHQLRTWLRMVAERLSGTPIPSETQPKDLTGPGCEVIWARSSWCRSYDSQCRIQEGQYQARNLQSPIH